MLEVRADVVVVSKMNNRKLSLVCSMAVVSTEVYRSFSSLNKRLILSHGLRERKYNHTVLLTFSKETYVFYLTLLSQLLSSYFLKVYWYQNMELSR